MTGSRKWRFDGMYNADANLVAQEIESIGDAVTAKQIVEKAKDESTELHKCFEWDDSIAAHKYRLHQAKHIVRCIVHVEDDGDGEEERPPIRCFVVTNSGEGYKRTDVVVRQEDEYKALLARAWAELRAFKAKYKCIEELREIFDLID